MNVWKAVTTSALLASASGFASVAMAQSGGAAEETVGLADIVVTATRDSRLLKDVPMSIDVVSGDKLQKLNVLDIKDIQQLSPGLELTNSSGRNNTTSLRGVSFDPDQGTAPSIRLYLNEVNTDAQFAFTSIYDLGQI